MKNHKKEEFITIKVLPGSLVVPPDGEYDLIQDFDRILDLYRNDSKYDIIKDIVFSEADVRSAFRDFLETYLIRK